jgi:predicted dehydrogenase
MSADNGRTRIIVVGIGGRGSWMAARLARDERYELVALCERNLPKLDHFKRERGLDHIPGYASIEECIDQEVFDAVAVTTPDGTHAEVALPALAAGKFVFLEKPLDITAQACRRIIEADAQAGGRTFVGHNLRFAPVYVKAKELVDRGEIGDVLTIQADEFYDGGRTYFRRWNRLRAVGGGLWITKASHDFDLLHWFAGQQPVSVHAFAELSYYRPREGAALYCADCQWIDSCPDSFYLIKRRRGLEGKLLSEVAAEHGDPRPDLCLYNSDKDTFDHGIATVEFEGRIIGTYTCNVVAGFTERRLRIAGTKGAIDGVLGGDHLTLRRRDPSATEAIPLDVGAGGHGGADQYLFDAFHAFTQGLDQPKVKPQEAMVAVLMGLAARSSSDEGRRVRIGEL